MQLANEKTCDVKFLYSNKTVQDILLRKQLDKIDREMDNISVRYTLTRQLQSTNSNLCDKFTVGRVNIEMLRE